VRFRKAFSIGVLAFSLPLGCAYVQPSVRAPTADEAAAVRSGEKTIVLLRLLPRLDTLPVTPLAEAYDASDGFWIFAADIDHRGKPGRTRWLLRAPSEAAAASNWAYLLLPPGAYWVSVLSPGEMGRSGGTEIPLQGNPYVLEIPAGAPVVYAGTLAISCQTVRKMLFWRAIDSCGPVAVEDETPAAQEVAGRDFGETGPVAASLLRPQGDQRYRGPAADLFPMGVRVDGTGEVGRPEWRKRGVGRATGLGGITGEGVGDFVSGMGQGGGYLGAAIVLGYALYLPFGTVGGYIAGSHSAAKWGPCVDGLGARIVEWSPPVALRESFRDAFARRGVGEVLLLDGPSLTLPGGAMPGMRSLLDVRILEVALRECEERWTFCPELTVRVRLQGAGTGLVLFDETLVHTDPDAKGSFSFHADRRPYEQVVLPAPRCLTIEECCGDHGAEQLISGLELAGGILAARVVGDLLGN
jgi:hypothetical protein